MRAAFLHGKAAVAVRQCLGGAAESLLGPGRLGQRAAGVDRDVLAFSIDLPGFLPVPTDGGVVEPGVVGCHLAEGVVEQDPHYLLGSVPVDEPGAESYLYSFLRNAWSTAVSQSEGRESRKAKKRIEEERPWSRPRRTCLTQYQILVRHDAASPGLHRASGLERTGREQCSDNAEYLSRSGAPGGYSRVGDYGYGSPRLWSRGKSGASTGHRLQRVPATSAAWRRVGVRRG